MGVDAGPAPDATDATPGTTWCSLGQDVPGAVVPAGFCMRVFAQVNSPRTLAFAPNGDLFVGAPNAFAAGGSHGGPGAVLVLGDDDRDGTAEVHTFVRGIPDVHGIALGGGSLYYTTASDVFRVPYAGGDRVASAPPESLHAAAEFSTGGRWTHGLARSVGGALYASRGAYASCGGGPSGAIYQVGSGSLQPVSVGFRNPMYLRCHYRDELCMAAELGDDMNPSAREKLLAISPQADFGYPCCFANNVPYRADAGVDCSTVAVEDAAMLIDTTPFGLDWERGAWAEPYANGLFVALHGSFYSSPRYQGAAVVYYPTDPATHRPAAASFTPFIGGWGHIPQSGNGGEPAPVYLSRPADVAFAPDGRMFVADDTGNYVYWVAPTTLAVPTR